MHEVLLAPGLLKARANACATGAALALALLLGACSDAEDPEQPSHVVAELSERIPTVVNVRWTTDVATAGYVEFGPTRELGSRTPLEAADTREHAATLLGSPADSPVFYRVVSSDGSSSASSDVASITTGSLPVGVPVLSQTGDGFDGFVVVPLLGRLKAISIIDAKGRIVWYYKDDSELDFYRARLSRDGKSVLYNAGRISGEPVEESALVRVALDGSKTESIPVPFLAHDFVEHPDGTLAAIAFEDRDMDGTRVRGNKLVEIDEDGNQETVWTSWDCFDPTADPGDDPEQGWTFANALDYDPTEDVYYVGMRNFSSIAKVNRHPEKDAPACEWVLGSYGSTFSFAPGSARFLHEHQFDVHGNRVVVMDNDGAPGDVSRLLEYELDPATMVATEVWSYVAEPSVYTFVLGEPIRLADGGTFVNWSTAGQMERLDAQGTPIWKLNSSAGVAFGFQTLAASLYGGGAQDPAR
ncbi:MAG: aryl-sulfate sulfotransferase [Myxococcales bacterium]